MIKKSTELQSELNPTILTAHISITTVPKMAFTTTTVLTTQ